MATCASWLMRPLSSWGSSSSDHVQSGTTNVRRLENRISWEGLKQSKNKNSIGSADTETDK